MLGGRIPAHAPPARMRPALTSTPTTYCIPTDRPSESKRQCPDYADAGTAGFGGVDRCDHSSNNDRQEPKSSGADDGGEPVRTRTHYYLVTVVPLLSFLRVNYIIPSFPLGFFEGAKLQHRPQMRGKIGIVNKQRKEVRVAWH